MSLFRKPKKNLRNRIEIDNEDDDEQNHELDEIHSSINKLKEKKKDKKKKKDEKPKEDKRSTLLSFDDELEDVEEFKVKKSKESRRLIKLREKEKKEEKDHKNGRSDYNDQEIQVIDEENLNGQKSRKNVKVIDDDIVYKDNVGKKEVDSWVISGREAEALHLEEEDFSDQERGSEEEEEDDDPIKKIIQSGGIPDAATIHAARKKREAARAAGGPPSGDFIPIDKKEGEGRKSGGRRLVREEDEEDAGEGEEERVSFTVKQRSKEDEYHKKAARSDNSDSEPETWERMQISKAINSQQLITASKDMMSNLDPNNSLPRPPQPPTISNEAVRSRPGPVVSKDLPAVRARLAARLGELKEVHRRHEMDADRAVDDIVESQAKIDQMGHEIPALSKKYKFYQELRGYMTDLTDCYDEKMVTISYLESRMDKVRGEQRGKVVERRRQDVRDQSEVLGAMTATNAALMVDPVQDAVRDYRANEREGRRMRRRQGREGRGEVAHHDGLSSDDELPSVDEASLTRVRSDVETQARLAMEDVVEEFSVISKVMERLESWRREDQESYSSAYVSLCLPRIFGPLIRLEMLFWDPLSKASPLPGYDWFSVLATFGLTEEDKFQQWEVDPDRNLISSCCEKVILPRLVTIVKSSYDPMSSSQTSNLVNFVSKVVSDNPTISMRSKHLRELFSVVVESIKECVDTEVYIPMYTKHQMETPNNQHSQFFNRQFWTVFKLYKNILRWAGILADGVLVELVLDKLLNRYLLMSLRANLNMVDSVFKSKQIVEQLPASWLKLGAPELKKMSMFTKYIGGVGCSQGLPRDAVIETARLVRILGDFETGEKLRELLY